MTRLHIARRPANCPNYDVAVPQNHILSRRPLPSGYVSLQLTFGRIDRCNKLYIYVIMWHIIRDHKYFKSYYNLIKNINEPCVIYNYSWWQLTGYNYVVAFCLRIIYKSSTPSYIRWYNVTRVSSFQYVDMAIFHTLMPCVVSCLLI